MHLQSKRDSLRILWRCTQPQMAKLSRSGLQRILDLAFHQVIIKPTSIGLLFQAITAFRLHPHQTQHRVDEEIV